jgi:C-terminal processing protease CtpA/Prc
MRRTILFLLLPALALAPIAVAETSELERILAFEVTHTGTTPEGWGGGPPATLHTDSTIVHSGTWSARIERETASEGGFSSLTNSIPIDFGGQMLEIRGFLRSEGVTGFFGLWMREDGNAGPVQFDNMQKRQLRGTTEWTEYSIQLPLDPRARTVFFGALLAGKGKVWVDDIQILVDGKPLDEAAKIERAATALDTDHEFDAGSGVEITTVSPQQIENLVTLGKVWGFLKYHHPKVMAGQMHWDYELFRVLPRVLQAEDRATCNAILLEWARSLGEPAPCSPCAEVPADVYMGPDLAWLQDGNQLGAELSTHLEEVYRNRPSDAEQIYVSLQPNVGNPDFANENGYRSLTPVDAGYRVLALYRFWNIVQYWSPYRDLVDGDWHAVLTEFVPRLVAAEDSDAYRLELIALVARLYDTHTNLWGSLDVQPPRGECVLPVRVRFIEGEAVVVGFHDEEAGAATGLVVGDVIENLDGESIASLIEEWSPYYAASNDPTRLRDIARALTRGECGHCSVSGTRAGKAFELEPERIPAANLDLGSRRWHDLPGETFRKLSDEVAYLKLSSVEQGAASEYVRKAAETRGLVIDIRNYPASFMVFALGQFLVQERTPFARFTRGDLANPGAFVWSEPLALTPAKPHYDGKVVILVDEVSQSSAEYTTMAFRVAPGAIVVGSTTAGADGNVSTIPLPGGLRTMISGIGVFYPDKAPTQRIGIVPDVRVEPTIEGIRVGRDEVLEEALRQILGADASETEIRQMARP